MQTNYVLREVGTELLNNTEKNIMLKSDSGTVHTFIPFTLNFKLIIF
jgi:hypothetical protein